MPPVSRSTYLHFNSYAFALLTIAPALSLTNSAQAAPAHRGPVVTRSNQALAWNNYQRQQDARFDSRYNAAPRVQAPQAPRFDQYRDAGRSDDHQVDSYRNDSYRDNGRFDARRDNNRGRNNGKSDTGKIIGAGIVGAILGAVLPH